MLFFSLSLQSNWDGAVVGSAKLSCLIYTTLYDIRETLGTWELSVLGKVFAIGKASIRTVEVTVVRSSKVGMQVGSAKVSCLIHTTLYDITLGINCVVRVDY